MNILNRILSFIFPHSPKATQALSLPLSELCTRVTPTLTCTHECFAFFSYRHPLIRSLVHGAKFEGSHEAIKRIAFLMCDALLCTLTKSNNDGSPVEMLIVPVPLSSKRLFDRGFNQSERLAGALLLLEPRLGTLCTKFLARTRNTQMQSHIKDPHERKKNVEGAFTVTKPEEVRGRVIVLIDDVVSTGSTMSECRKVLESSGAKTVICIAFAH